MIRNILLCILASATFFMSGCSTKISATIINHDLYQASDSYVVVSNQKSNMKGVDGEIVSALGEHGISAKILNEREAADSHAPVIVTYQDWYKWDLVQYLWTLDIYFNDMEMKPFAHANFHHGGLHTFPDRRDIVRRLIDQIMLKL
jgi:hypothetical protein